MSYNEIVYPYIEGEVKNPPIIDVKEIKAFLKLPLDADEYLDIELSDMAETALEYAEKYCRQGMKLVVEGRIQTGSYTNKDGVKVYTTEVVVENQEFAESKKAAGESEAAMQPNADGFMQIPDGIEDELPFE